MCKEANGGAKRRYSLFGFRAVYGSMIDNHQL